MNTQEITTLLVIFSFLKGLCIAPFALINHAIVTAHRVTHPTDSHRFWVRDNIFVCFCLLFWIVAGSISVGWNHRIAFWAGLMVSIGIYHMGKGWISGRITQVVEKHLSRPVVGE